MTKNPSRKLSEVFILIIPQFIRIHLSKWIVAIFRHRRGVKILKDIDIPANYNIIAVSLNTMIPHLQVAKGSILVYKLDPSKGRSDCGGINGASDCPHLGSCERRFKTSNGTAVFSIGLKGQ